MLCFFFVCVCVCVLLCVCVFFLMIRRPPRSTLDRSSAASDVYKRQTWSCALAAAQLVFARNHVRVRLPRLDLPQW